MKFANGNYLQKAQVEELGASLEVWADSAAAKGLPKHYLFETATSKQDCRTESCSVAFL